MHAPESKLLLLLFAYHFPPENAIGGLRPYRFSKYLARLGVSPHTITGADVSTRPDLEAETVSDPFVTRPRQGLGWQIERAIRKFLLPGATGSQWAVHAYIAACKFLDSLKTCPPTFVFSTYPPLGTPLAGYFLARRRNLPWILDFRDPMGDNPGDKHLAGCQKAIYRYLERKFISAAACVLANTDAAQIRLQQAYPNMAYKIHLLWNGFDPEQRLAPLPVLKRDQRIYSHVGELYGGRVITSLLLSIDRLIQAGRLSPKEILIQLIGPVRSTSVPPPDFLAQAADLGWLKIRSEQLPQTEAHKIMCESDGLLLVQPHSTLQVPGKLFEYIQIGRPVLAYILPDTPIERILKQSKIPCEFVYSSDANEQIDDAVCSYFHLDTAALKPSEWFEQNFNAQRHAEQLFHLMTQLQADFTKSPAPPFATTTVSR